MNQEHQKVAIHIIAEEGVEIPQYASQGASGADVQAYLQEEVSLLPGEKALIPTGLRFAIPVGYEIQVRPRSGLAAKHGITVLNTPGTVDADYRGEVKVIVVNHGTEPFTITSGMRIAQLVIAPVVQAEFIPSADLVATKRGEGGFGHTGLTKEVCNNKLND